MVAPGQLSHGSPRRRRRPKAVQPVTASAETQKPKHAATKRGSVGEMLGLTAPALSSSSKKANRKHTPSVSLGKVNRRGPSFALGQRPSVSHGKVNRRGASVALGRILGNRTASVVPNDVAAAGGNYAEDGGAGARRPSGPGLRKRGRNSVVDILTPKPASLKWLPLPTR